MTSPLARPLLAIETSCDDTACAILSPQGHVLAARIVSQKDHAALGGVVPEIAARAHLDLLPTLVTQVLDASHLTLPDLGAIAASTGPGLIGGLIVGTNFGKGLALSLDIPFIAVNHIEAHALTARLPGLEAETPAFPYLLLLVSGGHCQCVAVHGAGRYERLGGTIDDAAGEAFDKVAKMLGLGWPGGPALEALARTGNPNAVALPRPLLNRDGCDFSFSGLKTAVSRHIAPYGNQALPHAVAADIAASFQRAVAEIMANRAEHALAMMPEATSLVVAGGVAANTELRTALTKVAHTHSLPFHAPPPALCTDNAIMVGWAALEALTARTTRNLLPLNDIETAPRPRWPLAEMEARLS